jgi:hypothetical protein
MEKIDEGFQKRLTDQPQIRGGFTPKRFTEGRIEDFLRIVEAGTVAEHGAYAQMIWELAVTAPVEYMKGGPIRTSKQMDSLVTRLQEYRFRAYVDGVELRKPIHLPAESSRLIEQKVYPVTFERLLSENRKLSVTGYLYWQKGRILPRELQGILVRVRNVAVGQYDPTYLGYPHHEGWKFSQMTGELYVDDGLDQAVNIDRSSFRESDDGFIEFQTFLFEKLKGGTDEGAGIFTDIKRETGKIREEVRRREERRRHKVVSRLAGGLRKPLSVEHVKPDSAPSGVALKRGSIRVQKDLIERVPRKHRQLFLAICGIVEKEIGAELTEGRRKRLYDKLAALFEEF